MPSNALPVLAQSLVFAGLRPIRFNGIGGPRVVGLGSEGGVPSRLRQAGRANHVNPLICQEPGQEAGTAAVVSGSGGSDCLYTDTRGWLLRQSPPQLR